MTSICKKVRLQQLRKAKYSILATICTFFKFFFLQSLVRTCTIHCLYLMIFLYFALNLETFFKKCDFLEKFILSFFLEQDHYEGTRSFEKEICSRQVKLIEAFQEMLINQLQELINIVSKEILSMKASSSARHPLQISQTQCICITKENFNAANKRPTSSYPNISRNNLILCRYKAAVTV